MRTFESVTSNILYNILFIIAIVLIPLISLLPIYAPFSALSKPIAYGLPMLSVIFLIFLKKEMFAYVIILWTFVWENYKMFTQVAGYDTFKLISLPEIYRYFDSFLVVLALLYVITNKYSAKKLLLNPIVKPLMLGLGLALVSILFNGTKFIVSSEMIMKYFRPLFIFLAFSSMNFQKQFPSNIIKILFIIASVNAFVGLYQITILNYIIDNVTGLLRDAHVFTNHMFIISFFGIAYIYIRKRWRLLPSLLFFITPAIFASHMKANYIYAIVLFILILLIQAKGIKSRIYSITAYAAATYIFISLIRHFDTTFSKIGIVSSHLSKVGIIWGYLKLPQVLANKMSAFILGFGPGNYSSGTSFVLSGGQFQSDKLIDVSVLTGVSNAVEFRASVGTAIIGELGVVCFVLFIIIFVRILLYFYRLFRNSNSDTIRWQSLALFMYLIFLILLSLVSTFSSYEVISMTLPFFILAGVLYSITQEEAQNKS